MELWYEMISQYGYIGIFILLILGIIGLPIPDEVLITYLGFITSLGTMDFALTLLTAVLGAICGISISYVLGKILGEPFLRKFGPKFFITEKTIQKTKDLFHKYGSFVLFICYFVPGVRHIAAYLAGITRFSFKRFTLFAYTGAFVWVLVFLALGHQLGNNWGVISDYIHKYSLLIFILILLIASTILVVYFVRQQKYDY